MRDQDGDPCDHPRVTSGRGRAALLEREKAHTRLGDDLARQRREFPGSVEKEYSSGRGADRKTLPSCSTAVRSSSIYHFMFGPSYGAGCPVDSSIADSFDGLIPHLKARDGR